MQLYRSSMITVIHGRIVILLGVAGFSEFFDGAEKRAIADQRVISFVGCAIYVEIKSFYTATIEIIGSELDRFIKKKFARMKPQNQFNASAPGAACQGDRV